MIIVRRYRFRLWFFQPISSKTRTSITLQITGFATSRQVSQISLQFSARAGENVATTSLSIEAGSQFTAWYQSSPSVPFGSMFTVTVPLNFAGSTNSVTGQANAVQSIGITLSNAQGNSNSVTVQNSEG